MAEGYSRISELLALTYTSHDDASRKQAEQELELISQDKTTTITALLYITATNSNPHLRQASSTKLHNFLKHLNENSLLTSLDQCQISEEIFNIMLLNLEKPTLSALSLSLNSLLSNDKNGLVYSKLSQFVGQNIHGPIPSIKACFQVIKLLFSTLTSNFSTKNYFQNLLPNLIGVGQNALTMLGQAFTSQNEEQVRTSLGVLNDWAECFSQILEHFEIISPKVLKQFLKNSNMAELFLNIIFFKLSDSFISLDLDLISQDFTSMKANVLKSLNILMQFTIESKKKLIEEQGKILNVQNIIGVDLPETYFVVVCVRVIKMLIESLLEISRNHVLSEIISEPGRIFVIESLDLCVKCCKEAKFFTYFSESYRNFIIEFIPNALTTTKEEVEKSQTDAQEFVNLGMDICETQESENIRTTSAKLLEAICESIDGALSFFIGLIVQSFDLILNDRLSNINSDQIFYFSYDEEKVLNNCLIMLCIVSYNISRRKDLIKTIENLLTKYFDLLVKAQSAVISSRLCLFLYFYAEHIFQNYEKGLINLIWFLVNTMGLENSPQIVVIQACETFSALVQNEEIILRIHSYIPEIFAKLIFCITNQENKDFFEAVCEFFKWHQDISYDLAAELVQKLAEKILVLASGLNLNKGKGKGILISKCWNIIKTICGLETFTNDFRSDVEGTLLPLISLIGKKEAEGFEDDIVIVIMSIMRQNQKISHVEWEVFNMIPALSLKQQGTLQNLLKLISSYILYGHDYILNNPNILFTDFICSDISDISIKSLSLIELASRALYSKKADKIKEIYNAEGAILLQLLLASFPNCLDNALPVILSSVFTRYKTPQIKQNFFKIRLLCIVLQGFVYNFSLTTSLLSREIYAPNISYLRFVILEIISNYSSFKNNCDKKLMILGLSQILVQTQLPQDINNLVSNVFEILIMILSTQTSDQPANKSNMNKLLKKILQEESYDLDDSEIMVKGTRLMYSDPDNTSLDENESSITCTQLLTSLKDFDEISHFKQILHTLNTSSPSCIKSLISSLTEIRKNQLTDIVSSTTITFDHSTQEKAVRKIVKAKRK